MDSLMGSNLKEFRSYGVVKHIEIVEFCGVDLMGVKREAMGMPWNEDLWSKKDGFGFEESEEVRVVAMAAIEVSDMLLGLFLAR